MSSDAPSGGTASSSSSSNESSAPVAKRRPVLTPVRGRVKPPPIPPPAVTGRAVVEIGLSGVRLNVGAWGE